MDDMSVSKFGLGALFSIIAYLTTQFSEYFVVFIILMSFDYITGVVAAFVKGTKSSKIGFMGIIKKIMYVLFVVFMFLIDYTIVHIANGLGFVFSFANTANISFGTLTLLFFIGNESVSIIENFEKIGIKSPKWLKKIINLIKSLPNMIIDKFISDNKIEVTNENKEDGCLNTEDKRENIETAAGSVESKEGE